MENFPNIIGFPIVAHTKKLFLRYRMVTLGLEGLTVELEDGRVVNTHDVLMRE